MKKTGGIKFDQDVLALDLIPPIGLLLQGDVYTRGKRKYGSHNWRAGIAYSRILGAMFRHLVWYMAGEKFDPKDGQHHLSSVAWGANSIMEYEISHPEFDDRYIPFPPEKIREMLANLKVQNVEKSSPKISTPKPSKSKHPRNKKKRM